MDLRLTREGGCWEEGGGLGFLGLKKGEVTEVRVIKYRGNLTRFTYSFS